MEQTNTTLLAFEQMYRINNQLSNGPFLPLMQFGKSLTGHTLVNLGPVSSVVSIVRALSAMTILVNISIITELLNVAKAHSEIPHPEQYEQLFRVTTPMNEILHGNIVYGLTTALLAIDNRLTSCDIYVCLKNKQKLPISVNVESVAPKAPSRPFSVVGELYFDQTDVNIFLIPLT